MAFAYTYQETTVPYRVGFHPVVVTMEYEANRGNTSLQIWHWFAWDDDSVVKLRPLMRHAKHLHLDPEVALLRHPEIVPSKEGRYFAFATELAILLGVSATQDNFDICLTWESDTGV